MSEISVEKGSGFIIASPELLADMAAIALSPNWIENLLRPLTPEQEADRDRRAAEYKAEQKRTWPARREAMLAAITSAQDEQAFTEAVCAAVREQGYYVE